MTCTFSDKYNYFLLCNTPSRPFTTLAGIYNSVPASSCLWTSMSITRLLLSAMALFPVMRKSNRQPLSPLHVLLASASRVELKSSRNTGVKLVFWYILQSSPARQQNRDSLQSMRPAKTNIYIFLLIKTPTSFMYVIFISVFLFFRFEV